MVMSSLSEHVWKLNSLDSLKNDVMKSADVEHAFVAVDHNVQTAQLPEAQGKNWKLMIDPVIKGKGHTKVIRYGGTLDGPDEKPAVIKDPRFGSIMRQKEVDLILVPKFKYDKWSVGSPPMKSIFIYGLNDNVNQEFLLGLFQPLGSIDQLKVYYHPKTTKHLGIAFVSFSKSSVTKEVLARFHGTSVMGNIVNIKPDPLCQITKKVLDKLIKAPGVVVNIPEIIQNVELRSQHKTAAYAFRHNERSQQYYTARGKVRKPSDLSETPKSESMRRDSLTQEEPDNHDTVPVQHDLKLEQVSPKIDTPPDTEISPIHPEEDIMAEQQSPVNSVAKPVKRERSPERETAMTPELKYKVPKSELMSPADRHDERRRDARLYEMDRERRKDHSERKYEEWKMRTEMQIRAEKTSRYVKEHCSGSSSRTTDKYSEEKYPPEKYPSEKYAPEKYAPEKYAPEKYPPEKYSKDKYSSSKDHHHMSERERYYAYYDKYYRDKDRPSDHRYMDDKHRSKYDKYDKYAVDKYSKYYEYHRHSDHKPRSSSKELEKLQKLSKSVKDYEKYENVYHRESPRTDHVLSLHEAEKHRHLATPDPDRKSRSRPRDEQHLVDRVSKRKRSKSPIYHRSPISVPEPKKVSPKTKMENSGSATSHDTGYHSISPLPVSPPAPKQEIPQDISVLSENPYGCARAVPRKDISKVKVIGQKSDGPSEDMSSSSMSLDEGSAGEEESPVKEMRLEDISPNTTPQQPLEPTTLQPPIPLLPVPTAALLITPALPPVQPVQYQTGQWLHTTYPDMYQYGYESYNPDEAADILARREAEEKAANKRLEQARNKERKNRSLDMMLSLMESILMKDVKIILNEKTAFTKLEEVWNQEEDKKKKEEEELAAKKKEDMANNADQTSSRAPDMPSLSEMRSMSDAKQSSHIRQANLSFKVPKLNRGMRPQVIVKKMQLPKKLDSAEEPSDDEVNDLDIVAKRKQVGNRYNKIYSSSSSSESDEEGEEVQTVLEKEAELSDLEPKEEITLPSVTPPKYTPRLDEEDILVLEQLFREDLTEEDKGFFKTAYDQLFSECRDLLEGVTWLSAPEIPYSARRRQPSSADVRHRTGCARTEGFYRMTKQEKMALKFALYKGPMSEATPGAPPPPPIYPVKKVDGRTTARSTRAMQRRQATHYLTVPEIQFMQLTTRRKQVKFMRSDIHDWGLFAQEPIMADELVIEYVGEVVREIIANIRERGYEKEGIGSSYLFRIDQTSYIVDATHKGSISRFINHNCDPNCYARVISVGTKKKIGIYSKRDIDTSEEITYDYKFAIEEEANKISCLCKSPLCRGFLN